MTAIKEKLEALSNGKVSDYRGQARWRRENRDWLKKSQAIAFEVLEALDEKNITQKTLAALMNVSPQYVNNIVRGRENLTLETISRLERALGIELIAVIKLKPGETSISQHTSAVKNTKVKSHDKKAA